MKRGKTKFECPHFFRSIQHMFDVSGFKRYPFNLSSNIHTPIRRGFLRKGEEGFEGSYFHSPPHPPTASISNPPPFLIPLDFPSWIFFLFCIIGYFWGGGEGRNKWRGLEGKGRKGEKKRKKKMRKKGSPCLFHFLPSSPFSFAHIRNFSHQFSTNR